MNGKDRLLPGFSDRFIQRRHIQGALNILNQNGYLVISFLLRIWFHKLFLEVKAQTISGKGRYVLQLQAKRPLLTDCPR